MPWKSERSILKRTWRRKPLTACKPEKVKSLWFFYAFLKKWHNIPKIKRGNYFGIWAPQKASGEIFSSTLKRLMFLLTTFPVLACSFLGAELRYEVIDGRLVGLVVEVVEVVDDLFLAEFGLVTCNGSLAVGNVSEVLASWIWPDSSCNSPCEDDLEPDNETSWSEVLYGLATLPPLPLALPLPPLVLEVMEKYDVSFRRSLLLSSVSHVTSERLCLSLSQTFWPWKQR